MAPSSTQHLSGRASAALVAAIHGACDPRGDTDANRAALIAEASAFDADGQLDMIEHFEAEARIWLKATGAACTIQPNGSCQ